MGKSPFIRTAIAGKRCLIFDIQNEYGTRVKYEGITPVALSEDTKKDRSRYTGSDVDKFIDIASTKRKTIVVFEEATAFFGGKTEKNLRRYLINRYHTGNISFFIFHSIQSVPPFVFDACNYVVLFKTLDIYDNVRRKRPEILKPWQALRGRPNGEKFIIKLI